MLRRAERRRWEETRNGRSGRSPAWRNGVTNARREAMAYPGTKGLPVRGNRRREALFRGETGAKFATPIRRSAGQPSSSSRSEARSSDIAEVCSSRRRLSKLFIVDITFYSRRAAAARRPDGASVVSRDGGCGEEEKKGGKKVQTNGTRVV